MVPKSEQLSSTSGLRPQDVDQCNLTPEQLRLVAASFRTVPCTSKTESSNLQTLAQQFDGMKMGERTESGRTDNNPSYYTNRFQPPFARVAFCRDWFNPEEKKTPLVVQMAWSKHTSNPYPLHLTVLSFLASTLDKASTIKSMETLRIVFATCA